jgi:hypothetical protein
MKRWNWMRGYEGFAWGWREIRWEKVYAGFAWGCLIAAAALLAGAALPGCSLHLHYGEKHYCGETLRGSGQAPQRINAESDDAGIEIVIPDEGRSKIEDRS